MSETAALIIGGGGREHALGLAVSPDVDRVYFTPGNAGTEQLENGVNLPPGDAVEFAKTNQVNLTIIGPEAPLVAGVADRLRAEGLTVFGPNAAAARLESSKIFACGFMGRHRIRYPATQLLTDPARVDAYTDGINTLDVVLKADGLAGGKGVVLPDTFEEMQQALHGMLTGELFDGAGKNAVLMQERLTGPEVSVFVISDGENFTILPYSQDHKRLKDGDEGPNTGGMGAYAPVPDNMISRRQHAQIYEIAEKTIAGMKADGIPYKGVLYMGLMLADKYDGAPAVIEYNVRFGDPEAQVVLPILEQAGVSIYELLASSDHRLDTSLIKVGSLAGKAALTVCLAAEGYPDSPVKGAVIEGLEGSYRDVLIHHGGTKMLRDSVIVDGGRVLYVTGFGESVDGAAARAYAAIGPEAVHFDNMQYRTDIGKQARRVQKEA